MILLVRHGESEGNRDGLVMGQLGDFALTDAGREQAVAAREAIRAFLRERGLTLDGVVASDLRRARETAEVVGTPVTLDPRLREWHMGSVQGLSKADAYAAVEGLDWSDPDARPGGGESAREVAGRMSAALADLAGRTAVAVSHGDAMRTALNAWCGHEPAQGPWIAIGRAAVFALPEPGRYEVVTAGTSPPA
ncbi:histidine phosphatase family protein [Jatrophihabitans fulvus]